MHSWSLVRICALLIFSVASSAEEHQLSERSPAITLANDHVSFVPPPGFTPLSAEWLAAKYPNPGAPTNAIGNATRTTSIAYGVLNGMAPSADLQALRKLQMQGFSQLPKLKWLASEVRRIRNHEWVYQEFTAAAADQDIHNIVLLTVVEDRVVLFNFNSTTAEFERVEAALRASIATITVSS